MHAAPSFVRQDAWDDLASYEGPVDLVILKEVLPIIWLMTIASTLTQLKL